MSIKWLMTHRSYIYLEAVPYTSAYEHKLIYEYIASINIYLIDYELHID